MWESIIQIAEVMKLLGITPFNAVLIIMVFFLMTHIGVIPKFWQKQEEKEEEIKKIEEETPAWAIQLLAYFNHDTTEHHRTTNEALKGIAKTSNDTLNLLREIDKYGVKCRDTSK